MKIKILIGLPGSGKTTYSEQHYNEYKSLNMDYLISVYKNKSLEYILEQELLYSRRNEFILDGLFLKEEDIIRIINTLESMLESVEIHYWYPDREKCLYNDTGRRSLNSKAIIKNATLEKPDLKRLREKYPSIKFSIKYHDVIKKPEWKFKMEQLGINIEDKKYLRSERWCTGGAYGNCWNSTLTPISPENALKEFKEFDDLIEKNCPDMPFRKYKEIYNECVTVEAISEREYYGGCSYYSFYQCDLEKLYNMLIKMEIIKTKTGLQ